MNKRIVELIKQAGGHWNYGDFNMPASVEFQEQDIEKFVELIVRECAEVASDYDGAHYVGTAIQKHFGVEE